MNTLAAGARRLPLHHVTVRVPWHDAGWTGSVCTQPLDNTSCLILPRIGEGRRDDVELRHAGKRFDQLASDVLPPCVSERVSFMAPFPLVKMKTHPYADIYPETHGHFASTRFDHPPYSAACVPFRWMLRANVEGNENQIGLADRLRLGWRPEREPDIRNRRGKPVETAWIQERDNQLALLDTFFGALRPDESLCFFYAKRTPLSEQSRRVIVGVGRVLRIGAATEYANSENGPLRCVLWERNVVHSVRPGYADGFLFPYQEALALAAQDGVDPEEFVAFAPDEHFNAYSYGSEHLTHDGAVASLVTCAAALHRIKKRIDGPWDLALGWIDTQLNRLWKARGAFPGLGSALSAFGYEWGFQHGSLLAYEIEIMRERLGEADPWRILDAVMETPSRLDDPIAKLLTPSLRKGWTRLAPERRALLQLLSRCTVSEEQALRVYDTTARKDAGIETTAAELLANPYLLFEQDRRSPDAITFGAVDRGLFPDDIVRERFPVPEPSHVGDPADRRRVRALAVDLLEEAAGEGHTLLPRSWIIRRARERMLQPPCPLGENVLDATEERFAPVIDRTSTRAGEAAYQIDRLAECRRIIRREINRRRKGRRHAGDHDWRKIVDSGPDESRSEDARERKERARDEQAAGLEELYRSRVSVLLGPAGTGKTTLLGMLCSIEGLADKGLLLLAPTGKARVRLEKQTKRRGAGQTLAQFLLHLQRYDGDTGAYFPNPKVSRCGDYRTVIVDECSMLTEEQLAALIDSLANVERLVLVGDVRQLPPIGAGRPFVDIVNELQPTDIDAAFPRCGSGYAELTIPHRQQGKSRADVLLAAHFNGQPLDPGADAVLDGLVDTRVDSLRLVQWEHPQELQEKLVEEIVRGLKLSGADDELGFEETLGGSRYKDLPWAFFWNKFDDNPGVAAKAETWQVLSPVRAGFVGTDALNRRIQAQFRVKVRAMAKTEGWGRKVPQPFGPQGLLYGDKVINVRNQRRRDVWPKPDGEAYIANGDIGIVVGQYKRRKSKSLPRKLEVEWAGQPGHKYGFHGRDFDDEGSNPPIELAYCLTVHKTQGSEFGLTFVVLTHPCWLLSRELLYTALTRHRDRLVVLHQGPLDQYRRHAGEEHSEIAGRVTNLFSDPLPREVTFAEGRPKFLEDGLIHHTEHGDLVRSKSELVIADKLHARGIDYAYEQPLALPGGRTRYPDFTIVDDASGVTYYWEHLGLLHDPGYRSRWEAKRAEYFAAGIRHPGDGADSERILIETHDEPGGGLDAAKIAALIDRVILA